MPDIPSGANAGAGSPTTCPSVASESTESAQDPSAAPVYRPGVEKPAESRTAFRERMAAAMAESVDSNAFKNPHPAWEGFRNVWRGYADAALAALDGAGAVPGEQTNAGPSHWERDPGHGGLTKHTGTTEDCPGPDCGPSAFEEHTGSGNE